MFKKFNPVFIHTNNLSVFISGGSNKRSTASINTNIAITIKNKPFIKPDKTSTRPNLNLQKITKIETYSYENLVKITHMNKHVLVSNC